MGNPTDQPSGGTDDDRTFQSVLQDLKANGANILVVGTVPDEIHQLASRQLLGTADGPSTRRRLLAYSGREVTVDERLPAGAPRDADHLQVVVHDVDLRSADAAASPARPADEPAPATQHVGDGLEELGTAITGTIDDLATAAGNPEPAEIRLCLDSIAALLGSYDRSAVLVFLHLVTERLNRVQGLGHYHLPVDRDDEVVSTLVPLFEVTVELRFDGELAEQRWHLQDGLTSEWFPLDSTR